MKPNQTKYLLGFALIAIWGLLGFRVYAKYANQNQAVQFASLEEAPLKIIPETQAFELTSQAYKDPFLSTSLHKKKQLIKVSANRNINSKKRPEVLKKSKPIKFPAIAYKGHIVLKTGRKAAVLKVDGELINLGWGNSFKEVNLMQIYEDSIRIKYKNVEKTILKNR